jgi:hypothetical protein
MQNVIPKRRPNEASVSDSRPLQAQHLQVIQGGRNRSRLNSATAMNPGIRDSVIRLVFDSPLQIGSVRKAARLAGTSEGKALDAIRNYVYDLRIDAEPQPPKPPGNLRRAA